MVNLKACLTRKYSNLTHSNTRSHTWGTQRVESSDIYTHNMQNSHVNKKNPPVVHAVAIRRRHPSAILFFQPRRSGICVVMRGDCDRWRHKLQMSAGPFITIDPKNLLIENLYNSNREVWIYTGMSYRNCFENNCQIWQLFSKQSSSYNKQYVLWMFSCALTLQCFASDSSAWGSSPHEFLTRITCFLVKMQEIQVTYIEVSFADARFIKSQNIRECCTCEQTLSLL